MDELNDSFLAYTRDRYVNRLVNTVKSTPRRTFEEALAAERVKLDEALAEAVARFEQGAC